jgi:para-nitrobenzyl esterase
MPPDSVKTTAGVISGVSSSDGAVITFKGIPYAAPPVGSLRWHAPRPAIPWKGTKKADQFGASCMQGPNSELLPWTKEFMYVTPPSEDCLFLNIWTPKLDVKANLPVLVFIHGGAFTSGSGDVPVYDGEALARSGMIIVTINYRLGLFGFLAHPQLTAESDHHSSGNYALLDQIAALRWVKQNIRGFGGDPAHITIAGQSAGAASVLDLLASPLAGGLFIAAIADSGIREGGFPMQTLAEAEKAGESLVSKMKADSIESLRAIPAAQLFSQAGRALRFGPVIDGWMVPNDPITLTTTRNADNDVPVITGFQANDSRLGGAGATSAEQFQKHVRQIYGPLADDFLKLYPAYTDEQAKEAEIASGRDRVRAGMYIWASRRTSTHRSPVFAYYFDRAIPWPAHPEFGAFHSGELPYAFGNLDKMDRPWEPEDHRISKMMMAYWKNMAAKGDPNGSSVPHWAPVDPSTPAVMRLGALCEPMPPAFTAKLDFWRRYFESPQSKNAGPF